MRARGMTDEHPDIVALNRQIADLRVQAANDNGTSGTPNPAYSSLQAMAGGWAEKRAAKASVNDSTTRSYRATK